MITKRGSRRRNILCLILGIFLCLLLQKIEFSSVIVGSANAEISDIYCLSKAGNNSLGAQMEADGKFYTCSQITVLDNKTKAYRDSVAWIRDIPTEIYVKGETAARNKLSIKDNPYSEDSIEGISWLNGFDGVPNVSPILIRSEYEK